MKKLLFLLLFFSTSLYGYTGYNTGLHTPWNTTGLVFRVDLSSGQTSVTYDSVKSTWCFFIGGAWGQGYLGNGFIGDGASAVDCGDRTEVEGLSQMSLTCWVKLNAFNATLDDKTAGIVTKWTGSNRAWQMSEYYSSNPTYTNTIVLYNFDPTFSDSAYYRAPERQKWVFIAWAWRARGGYLLYYNGILQTPVVNTIGSIASTVTADKSVPIEIGRVNQSNASNNSLIGSVDEVCIYNTYLTTDTVRRIYEFQKRGYINDQEY